MLLKLEPLPAFPKPGKSIDPLFSDIKVIMAVFCRLT